MLTLPPMLTRVGEMQKMPILRRRWIEKLVPMAIVAGSAGGTTIVIRSPARMRMTDQAICGKKAVSLLHALEERG